jgi:hypothetical protein
VADELKVPKGWKLVPIEPTHEMLLAYATVWRGREDFRGLSLGHRARVEYQAMLAAAPDAAGVPADDRLHTFLNAAAGEGLVLDGVDAADLYIAVFPERYRATIASIEGDAPGVDSVSAPSAALGVSDDEQYAMDRAADMLEGYAAYIHRVKPDEIEAHPYLPELENVASELRAFSKRINASGVEGLPAADYLAKVEADPKRSAALQRARERAAGVGEARHQTFSHHTLMPWKDE